MACRDLFSRELLRYLGPGFIVTIGFIDPGNWATNMAGGSQFGYDLLWVISLSTLMLIFLQHVAARLGIVTGRSLAVNVRGHFSRPLVWLFGVTMVPALIATQPRGDPRRARSASTSSSTSRCTSARRSRWSSSCWRSWASATTSSSASSSSSWPFIAGAYIVELFIVHPDMARGGAALGRAERLGRRASWWPWRMLGAIVMPHNIYLHSNTIQSREWDVGGGDQARLMRFELVDTTLSMGMGWLVNSAMILVAAAVFFRHGVTVNSIQQASATLRPLVGSARAVPLRPGAAGRRPVVVDHVVAGRPPTSSPATSAGPRTRTARVYRIGLVAMAVPAVVLIDIGLNPYRALILSQVVLSLQLPLTIVPLLVLSRRRSVMGDMRTGRIGHGDRAGSSPP